MRNKDNADIYNTIKDEITMIKLQPGSLISETEIAQRFGVSRTPIRQVFTKLSEEGLVDIIPQRGTFVSLIDLKYVEDIIFMRLAIETEIFGIVMDRMTEDDLNYLHDNLTKQKSVLCQQFNIKDMLIDFNALDNEFHRKLFQIADKINVWNIIHKLSSHYMRFRLLDIIDKVVMEELYNQHESLLELVKNKDMKEVRNHLEKHLKGGFNRVGYIQDQYHFFLTNEI